MTEKPKRKPDTGFSYEEGWNDGLDACDQWLRGRLEKILRMAKIMENDKLTHYEKEIEALLKDVSQ